MTLAWLEPETPKLDGVKPHVQRTACKRYALHLSWFEGRRRFIAWHTGWNIDHERVGEYTSVRAARDACDEHDAQLRGGTRAAA